MIVDLKAIADGPIKFEWELDGEWWKERGVDDQVAIDKRLYVKGKVYTAGDKYVLEGRMSGGIQSRCDRCAELYKRQIESDFRVVLVLPPADIDQTEVELMEDDMEVGFIMGEEINIDEIVREQVYLSLPMKSLCSEDCVGLCQVCGENLNRSNCGCSKEHGHPEFSKLKNFKIVGG